MPYKKDERPSWLLRDVLRMPPPTLHYATSNKHLNNYDSYNTRLKLFIRKENPFARNGDVRVSPLALLQRHGDRVFFLNGRTIKS